MVDKEQLGRNMSADHSRHPVVHLVGSIPLPDAETVFRTVSGAVGPHLTRLPDGETGIRKTWIRFLQDVLADNPAIELASDVPPFKFVQWDGKVVREIPRLRVKAGATPDARSFKTGYADMAIQSWGLFDRLQQAGVIPPKVKFQICIPTPIAPTYNNMVPSDRPKLLPALTEHFAGEVAKIAQALPNDRIALQWDVCQEVLAWEGYYEPGPVDVRIETIDVLAQRSAMRCRPRSSSATTCATAARPTSTWCSRRTPASWSRSRTRSARACARPIQFFHMPVPKGRSDDAYFAPLEKLQLGDETELYLGLIHHDDAQGDAARLAAARRHVRVDGIGTECGMARGDPARLPALLAAHARAAKLPA